MTTLFSSDIARLHRAAAASLCTSMEGLRADIMSGSSAPYIVIEGLIHNYGI
jgi:hypothetical protein